MSNDIGTRERILRAAAEVIRAKGLGKATTRAIAREAGLSEGALYKHFDSKLDLFLALLRGSPGDFINHVMSLPERAGKGTVVGNLKELAELALEFYQRSLPMGSSLFAEPELLERNRQELRARHAGPRRANEALADYLGREQQRGRVGRQVDVAMVADMLLGACFQCAYLAQFSGPELSPEDIRAYAASLARTLAPALAAPAP